VGVGQKAPGNPIGVVLPDDSQVVNRRWMRSALRA
jgi:hypothetical protein